MIDPAWVLALMQKAEPTYEQSPWRDTFASTATAIARAAERHPLPLGDDSAERTAAMLVGVAFYESHFQPDAEGDRPKLADGTRGRARSVCAMQIHETNFAAMKVTRAELLGDIQRCIDTGLEMLHISFSVCRAKPLERRIAHYAGGGNGCPTNGEATSKSEHRVRKALELFKAVPPPVREVVSVR